MSKLLSTLIAGACISTVLSAGAADQTNPRTLDRAKLLAMDDDGDGVITQAEYRKHQGEEKAWSTLDLNGDGKLDADELAFKEKSAIERTAPLK